MALTGLFLVSFLFVHGIGNLALFKNDGGEAFNAYTVFMTTSPIIRVMEIFLVVGFGFHIYTALTLTNKNKEARPQGYAYKSGSPGVTWFSQNMGTSGVVILVFLIIHLINFYAEYHYGLMYEGVIPKVSVTSGGHTVEVRNMYAIVESVFQKQWWVSVLYVGSMVLLGMHLAHGFQSAFKTFGIEHKKYTPTITSIGNIIAVAIPALFASMPLYFLLGAQ
jgi:succinate dehydrogenase / fumarate reductase cytochrome b subunit